MPLADQARFLSHVLPSNPKQVREVSDEAVWTVSSCKCGYGVEQLLEANHDTYWQSDGPQPHVVNIQFLRKMPLSFISLYVDYKSDESYTPSKVTVHIGSHISDLREHRTIEMKEPCGWQTVDLRDIVTKQPVRAFMLQFAVLQNHQNGRDTHIRQLKIYTPTSTEHFMRRLMKKKIRSSEEPQIDTPDQFATVEMNQFAIIR